jgi:hypothetical protein
MTEEEYSSTHRQSGAGKRRSGDILTGFIGDWRHRGIRSPNLAVIGAIFTDILPIRGDDTGSIYRSSGG